MAILGGLVLSALILLICVSIVGRTIGIGPINGDYELVEAGIAFSIICLSSADANYGWPCDGRHFHKLFTSENSATFVGGYRNFLCCDVNHGGMAIARRDV